MNAENADEATGEATEEVEETEPVESEGEEATADAASDAGDTVVRAAPSSRMDRAEQRRVVEALVLAAPEPLSAARIAEILPYGKPAKVKELVNELNEEYVQQDRAFEIWEVAGGYQIRTRAEFSGYLQKLQKLRPLRLSQAALETLSIIAYKQPVTRAEIEQVRGVDAGPVVKSLLERQLVKIAGQREVPGRPMVYATTKRFLEVFGLPSIKELPPLRELEELTRELNAAAEEAAGEASEAEASASTASEEEPGEIGAEQEDDDTQEREVEGSPVVDLGSDEDAGEAEAEADGDDEPAR